MKTARAPILGFAANSGTGKTTLLVKLLPLLKQRGVRIAVIKHAHHDFDIDKPGKDSYELRKAGAEQMLIASAKRWALMVETAQATDPRLDELVLQLDHSKTDLVLVEGFKHVAEIPKIEIHRAAADKPLLFTKDSSIIAIASDAPPATELPVFDLNEPSSLADFIVARFVPQASTTTPGL